MPALVRRARATPFDRIAATCAALVVVGIAVVLLGRDAPIGGSNQVFVPRVLLSLAAATLGATIPGFLDSRWTGRWLAIRAGQRSRCAS